VTDRPLRLGVVGTLVWDTIVRDDRPGVVVEEWGGIGYGLEALAAALPDGWEIRPLIKVGRDLSERAFRFLRSVPRVVAEPGVWVVPEPNNRVELRYEGEDRRSERLRGGVPAWLWPELAPLVRECDALYVNFISGFELELDTARALRASYRGPTYADLHSLFLGMGAAGLRVPRELPLWHDWLKCFDAIQVNEDEFDLLGRAWGDAWGLAAASVGPELKLIAVTLGARGAAYVASPGLSDDPRHWPETRRQLAAPGTSRSAQVPAPGEPRRGDPTGCGDVWGATLFARLLAGDGIDRAMAGANHAAAKNVEYRGAAGLHHHLRGLIVPARLHP
jgi:sugar/nucleoside kinase (ribokinase family)